MGFLGKTPKIFPVASIKRKVSGSCPGWRRATSCARNLAAAIASAALVKTEMCEQLARLGREDEIPANLVELRSALEDTVVELRLLMVEMRIAEFFYDFPARRQAGNGRKSALRDQPAR